MILAVCVDDRGGMLFNHRRQSRDKAVIEDLVKFAGVRRILVHPYSAPLFAGQTVTADERFLALAEKDDICFVENVRVGAYIPKCGSVLLYRWNRVYPADVYFDLDLSACGFTCTQTAEFAGRSHEKITREVYTRAL